MVRGGRGHFSLAVVSHALASFAGTLEYHTAVWRLTFRLGLRPQPRVGGGPYFPKCGHRAVVPTAEGFLTHHFQTATALVGVFPDVVSHSSPFLFRRL